ncbi:hypothetical protein C8J55DRAFT_13536 [Lentinula edodes]|uniref:Uncharacterized protein n=1 Tax=Lentinula lateritia TaxID=40482 RepID=A0A9W9E143_9AGAR|nr:hypothetical protein C8J55DRAFT_13536 [Lentinula edodes]
MSAWVQVPLLSFLSLSTAPGMCSYRLLTPCDSYRECEQDKLMRTGESIECGFLPYGPYTMTSVGKVPRIPVPKVWPRVENILYVSRVWNMQGISGNLSESLVLVCPQWLLTLSVVSRFVPDLVDDLEHGAVYCYGIHHGIYLNFWKRQLRREGKSSGGRVESSRWRRSFQSSRPEASSRLL